MQQVLWAEVILKAAAGIALLLAPLSLISIFGLQKIESGFWPRLLGAASLGIAAGIWVGLRLPQARGAIGPAGLIAINLATASAMLASLVLAGAAPSRRGKFLVAATAILLLGLAFIEIAHV